jgi:hypothetical protein
VAVTTTLTTAEAGTTTFRSERAPVKDTAIVRRGWQRPRARVFAALLAVLGAMPGCSSCGSTDEAVPSVASGSADLSPVPEPKNLLAELHATTPQATWAVLRELAGTPAALLPSTFPVLAASMLGLPPLVSGQIDADVPVVGALAGTEGGEPGWVVGLHVKSGRELVAQLGSGADASYAPRTDAASGVVVLEAKPGRASSGVVLGVVGNYLLASQRVEDLTALGPYVARSLPKQPQPREPIVVVARQAALKGPVVAGVRRIWRRYALELERADRKNREKHGGRAPDFGDPAAALAGAGAGVDMVTTVLESARELRLVIQPFPDRLDARLELSPGPAGAASELSKELTPGGLEPFLALPKDTLLAVHSRSSPAERQASAKASEERLNALFGDRLKPADQKLVGHALGELAAARGDYTSYAVLSRSEQTALVMRGAVADAARFDAGAKSLIKLLEVRAFAEPIRQFIGEVSVKQSSSKVAGIDQTVQRAVVSVSPVSLFGAGAPKRGEQKAFEVLWLVKDGTAYGVAARDAAPLLAEIMAADFPSTLGADPEVKRGADRAGQVATAVLARPGGFGLIEGGGRAPVLLTLGRTNDVAWLDLEVARPAVMGLTRSFAMP